jgi:hypothetical protein
MKQLVCLIDLELELSIEIISLRNRNGKNVVTKGGEKR